MEFLKKDFFGKKNSPSFQYDKILTRNKETIQ
jgi:hypothetical protein